MDRAETRWKHTHRGHTADRADTQWNKDAQKRSHSRNTFTTQERLFSHNLNKYKMKTNMLSNYV